MAVLHTPPLAPEVVIRLPSSSSQTDGKISYMRHHPSLFFTIAAFVLFIAFVYNNHSTYTAMFSRFNKLRDKVQGLAEDVHGRLNIKEDHHHTSPQNVQQPQQKVQPPPIPPKPVRNEAFAILRRRWVHLVVGDFDHIDRNEKIIKDKIAQMSWRMNRLLDTYNPTETQVFDNCGEFCATTVHFKNTAGRLFGLSIAWATPGTSQYQNDDVLQKLLHGIDVLYDKFFIKMQDDIKKCIQTRQNWWNIQIGAPQNLADLGVLLYDHLGDDRRKRLGDKIVELVGNPFLPSLKGGNRSWVSRILIVTGIFTDNAETIRTGIRCMSADGGSQNVRKNTLFGYIQPGDGEGLYKDGSLISHDVYPYAGGYGLIMLGSLARLLNLLNAPDSPDEFRITDPSISIIYDAVERNFMPVVWQGIVFEHVRGRGIARREGPGWDNGHMLIHAVALLSQGSPPPVRERLNSYVRLWQSSNPGDIFKSAEIPQIPILQSIISDPSLPTAPHPTGGFSCPMQEHFVYHAPNSSWCFTLSLCSTRIGRAEALNNENIKSWYQGDGMTYLYTSTHKTHYADDYWPTMDPLHAPGVTNHQIEPTKMEYKCLGFKYWSGGACWAGGGGGDGVAYKSGNKGARFVAVSMDHLSVDKNSAAKKSWFILENGVIALGAGCSGNSSPPSALHTTIESRNLDQPGRSLIINGQEYTNPPPWNKQSSRVHWAWLENTAGYIFLDAKDPNPTEKLFSRISKCGAWRDITGDGKPDECCREYVNIILNHGNSNPKDGKYAYAVLPLATREATEYLQANPTWQVLENSVDVQAIGHSFDRGEVTMATFWTAGKSINGVKVEQPCQVIWGRWGDEWCLTVSDPTHRVATVAVNLEIVGARRLRVGRKSDGVEVSGGRVIVGGLKDGATKSVFFSEGHDEL